MENIMVIVAFYIDSNYDEVKEILKEAELYAKV
jgi:hypothetical protein